MTVGFLTDAESVSNSKMSYMLWSRLFWISRKCRNTRSPKESGMFLPELFYNFVEYPEAPL